MSASDVVACRAALAALPGPQHGPEWQFRILSRVDHADYAVLHATRGDEVFVARTRDALAALFGEVATPAEATLLVQASGYNVTCGKGGTLPTSDGFVVQAFQGVGCGGLDRYLLSVTRRGAVEEIDRERLEDPEPNCVVGRRPAGLHSPRRALCARVGEYLARASTLEAASVEAFLRLAAELKAHGASHRLVAAARAAARDEVRHTRATARLARRFGAAAEAPHVEPMPLRELEAIALENASEGCVRETFGALVGRWQALHATEPAVRRVYARIAEDELQHAGVAWRVARWIEPRLSTAAQKRVQDARAHALRQLERTVAVQVAPDVRLRAGVPGAHEAAALLRGLAPALA